MFCCICVLVRVNKDKDFKENEDSICCSVPQRDKDFKEIKDFK